jgi:hypothetical protein
MGQDLEFCHHSPGPEVLRPQCHHLSAGAIGINQLPASDNWPESLSITAGSALHLSPTEAHGVGPGSLCAHPRPQLLRV